MPRPMCKTEWEILKELADGTLEWGAAVGACWGNLTAHGYVQPYFGGITQRGRDAVKDRFAGQEEE